MKSISERLLNNFENILYVIGNRKYQKFRVCTVYCRRTHSFSNVRLDCAYVVFFSYLSYLPSLSKVKILFFIHLATLMLFMIKWQAGSALALPIAQIFICVEIKIINAPDCHFAKCAIISIKLTTRAYR